MVQLASCVNLANSNSKEVARLKTYCEDGQARNKQKKKQGQVQVFAESC